MVEDLKRNNNFWMIIVSFLIGSVYAPILVYSGIGEYLMFKVSDEVSSFIELVPYPLLIGFLSYKQSTTKSFKNILFLFIIGFITAIIATSLTAVIYTVSTFS